MENKSLPPLVKFTRQTGANLTDLLVITLFYFLWIMFWPSGLTLVGVMSAWWENFSSESFSEKSAVDVQLLVINKLHSYCCKTARAERFFSASSQCQSRPTFIVAAFLSMSQMINRLKQQVKLRGRGASKCYIVVINGHFAFSLRHPP